MPGPLPLQGIACCYCWPANTPGAPLCICDDTERSLRAWGAGTVPAAMTPEQRTWCIDQIRSAGDATDQPTDDELATMGDAELARGVIFAWRDYARDKGLL